MFLNLYWYKISSARKLNQLKANNNIKSNHVITFDNTEKIILGRGHGSDVRINDISVSRVHDSKEHNTWIITFAKQLLP